MRLNVSLVRRCCGETAFDHHISFGETGRQIPESQLVESLEGPKKSLWKLTPYWNLRQIL